MKPLNLEDNIMECWNVVTDVNTVFEYVMESPKVDKDELSNMLLGIASLYDVKFNRLFREFEKVLKENSNDLQV